MSTLRADLDLPLDAIAALCRKYHVAELAIFGSALRGDSRPDSDVDFLVKFTPDARIGLTFFTFEHELSVLLGRKADLNTPAFLSPYFRQQVLNEAETIYAASG
jgi:predicted nucleotidyltransferase